MPAGPVMADPATVSKVAKSRWTKEVGVMDHANGSRPSALVGSERELGYFVEENHVRFDLIDNMRKGITGRIWRAELRALKGAFKEFVEFSSVSPLNTVGHIGGMSAPMETSGGVHYDLFDAAIEAAYVIYEENFHAVPPHRCPRAVW